MGQKHNLYGDLIVGGSLDTNALTVSDIDATGSIGIVGESSTTPVLLTINNTSGTNYTGEGIIQFLQGSQAGSRIIGGRDNLYGGASGTWRGNIKLQTSYAGGWRDGMKIDWDQNVSMYKGLTVYQASTATYLKVKATNYNSPALSLLSDDGTYGNPQIRYAGGIGLRFVSCNYDETGTTVRMQMRPNGNVQIGTTTDSGYKLDVSGSFRSKVDAAGWASWIENTSTSNSSSGLVITAGDDSTDNILLLRKRDGTEVFKVRGDGNVGIGTSTPATKLDVNGTANATGFSANGVAGYTGTFTIIQDAPNPPINVEVTGGIITNVT